MPGTLSWTPIPTSPKQPANAATFNSRWTEQASGVTNHFNGASARHILAEIDSPILDDTAQSVSLGTGATDLNTRALQLLSMLGRIAGGSGNAFTRVGAITPGTNDLATLATILATRTTSATINSLAMRDGFGDIVFRDTYARSVIASGALYAGPGTVQITDVTTGKVLSAALSTVAIAQGGTGATSVSAARTALGVPANDGTGATGTWAIAITGAAGSVPAAGITGTIAASQIDSAIARTANVPTNAGTGATGTWPIAITGAALTYTDRTIALSKLKDLAPSGTGTDRVVTVQAGSYLAVASSSIVQRNFAGGTITIASPVTGPQWTAIYVDNAGALQANPGTISGIQDTANLPTNGYAIGWAWLPQNGTALYSSQAEWQAAGSPSNKGYLVPQNANGGGPGSGVGGGTAGAPTTSPFGIWGDAGGLGLSANAYGVDRVLTGVAAAGGALTSNGVRLDLLRIPEKMIAGSSSEATLEDANAVSVTGNIGGAISTSGGSVSMRVAPGQPQITVKLVGFSRKKCDSTATITTNTVSVAGAYYLVADLNNATDRFTIALQTSVVAGQVVLRRFWFDGATIYATAPHGPYDPTIPTVNGYNFSPTKRAYSPGTTAGLPIAGSQTILPSTTPLTFNLADGGMTAWIRISGNVQSTASSANFSVWGFASTGAGSPMGFIPDCLAEFLPMPASTTYPFAMETALQNLGPGPVNFGIGYFAAAVNYVILSPHLVVEFTR